MSGIDRVAAHQRWSLRGVPLYFMVLLNTDFDSFLTIHK